MSRDDRPVTETPEEIKQGSDAFFSDNKSIIAAVVASTGASEDFCFAGLAMALKNIGPAPEMRFTAAAEQWHMRIWDRTCAYALGAQMVADARRKVGG
ncbi:MAG: hypothetical protein NVSMB31_14480 [Vulcanimicrobiaceae bacterium]